ncbi:MAG TPA: hypothetical protein VKF62_05770 [Planctomycetota bacterium]|nr:hypothetical protein [Planctomycetota bacterium]
MKHPRLALSVAALLAAGFAARPAPAQACGPLTFAFSTTGAGCAPGGGSIPVLTGSLQLIPGNPTCFTRLLLNTVDFLFPIPPTTLALGFSNPALPLPGLTGCTLWTSPIAFFSMSFDAGGVQFHDVIFPIPPSPSLIGTTAYAQAAVPVGGGFRISNGIQIVIS